MRGIEPKTLLFCFVASLVIALGASVVPGQESPKGQIVRGQQLAEALRAGGYVVYFRHAATNSDQVHAEKPDFVYRHKWRVGDLIVWDNRCSMHARDDFPSDQRRLMFRTTVKGSQRPY